MFQRDAAGKVKNSAMQEAFFIDYLKKTGKAFKISGDIYEQAFVKTFARFIGIQ